jgi:hypothetical protein
MVVSKMIARTKASPDRLSAEIGRAEDLTRQLTTIHCSKTMSMSTTKMTCRC